MTLQNFQKSLDPKLIKKGYDYFMNQCVEDLEEESPGLWNAQIQGTEVYEVDVKTKASQIKSWFCDYPNDLDEICRHGIVVFYAIAETKT